MNIKPLFKAPRNDLDDDGDYFYRQKPSDGGSMIRLAEPKIPDWIKPGMIVQTTTTNGTTLVLSKVDVGGVHVGLSIFTGEQNIFGLVVRTDDWKNFIDIIWGDDVGRVNAQRWITFEIASSGL